MKAIRYYAIVLFVLSLLPFSSKAQCTLDFSSDLNCSGLGLESNIASQVYRQTFDHYYNEYVKSQPPMTKAECEQVKAYLLGFNGAGSGYGCSIRIIAACRCVGNDDSDPMGIILGPQYGSSYNSTNPSSEVSDWQKDSEELMQRLGGYKVSTDAGETYVFGGRMPDAVNKFINKGGVKGTTFEHRSVEEMVADCDGAAKQYLDNPIDIDEFFRQKFFSLSGYNIAEIANKSEWSRSPDEKKALEDYDLFRKELSEKMAKEIDDEMKKKELEKDCAVLSLDCYGDGNTALYQTGYKNTRDMQLSEDMEKVKHVIDLCNKTANNTGFHADLYYNEETDKYVIAFRGTELSKLADLKQDGAIAMKVLSGDMLEISVEQYNLSMSIARVINKLPQDVKDKIIATGHSLGGGDASCVGVATGIETKTFNAATVPESCLKRGGFEEKIKKGDVQNITAYHTSKDFLTNAQKFANTEAIGEEVDLGDLTPKEDAEKARYWATVVDEIPKVKDFTTDTKKIVGYIVAGDEGASKMKEVSNADIAEMGIAHSMTYITDNLSKTFTEKVQPEWDRIKNNLINKGRQPDPLSQSSIHIKVD